MEVNTVAEGYDAYGHTCQKSVVMIDAKNHAIDEHEVVHDKSKAIDTNDDIDVDYDYDYVYESEDANDLIANPNEDINIVAEENNVHNVCVHKITWNDENMEQELSSADNEVEQNNVSQLNIQDIQNEAVNNNVGMEDADEIQGDDEQNNTSFWKVVQ